jgi:hypothetical protein
MTTTLNASTAGAGGFIATGDNSGSLALQTAGTTAVTIDTSQNVGIGTTSPSYKVDVNVGSSGGAIRAYNTANTNTAYFRATNSQSSVQMGEDGTGGFVEQLGAYPLRFFTNNIEGGRFDSSGNLLVGTTSAPAISGVPSNSFYLNSGTSGNWALGIQNTAASGGARGIAINYSAQTPNNTQSEPLFFSDSSAYRFRLVSNGGIYNYSANNSNISDQREKKNIELAPSYLNKICQIPVKTFLFNDQTDADLNLGVIAQDVQSVAPELVSESNWGTQEEPKMRLSVYQTDLQYALMKSIQELKAINDTQAETINALTARIVALEGA